MSLKVLFQSRIDTFDQKGGDTIQLLKTKEYLQRMGITVDVNLSSSPDLQGYDLVHLFNITKIEETYQHIQNAKAQEKKVVLSPIYWNLNEMRREFDDQRSFRRHLKIAVGSFFLTKRWYNNRRARLDQRYSFFINRQRFVLENADIILPNSQIEMDLLVQDFPEIPWKTIRVVPNGVDMSIRQYKDHPAHKALSIDDCILCVGRIEERKNQLRLLMALNETDIPLVFIGAMLKTQYVNKCRVYARSKKNVFFLGEITHDQLGYFYSRARVHALPSWYDTPGLTNLEAGLFGCNLALGDRGSVREYFGDLAYYCEPGDVTSIRKAVMDAYSQPHNTPLSIKIESEYTWDIVARKTAEAYQELVE